MAGEDGRVFLFASESTAGLHLHHAHFFGRKSEEDNEGLMDVIGTLE
jgi:hypothetical protein